MRRISPSEIGLLIIGGLLVLGGCLSVVNPKATVVVHQNYRHTRAYVEYVNQDKARLYGVMCIGLGCGLGALVFYRRK